MAERVDQLIPYGYAETWIGTFHAFGDRVLREGALEAGLDPEFRVLTRPEQIIFLRERLWRAAARALPAAGRSHAPPGRAARPGEPRQGRGRLARGVPRLGRGAAGRRGRRRGRARRGRARTSSWPPSTTALPDAAGRGGRRRLRRPDPPRARRCCARARRCWPSCARATATCWWTSSRTRTTPSSSWCALVAGARPPNITVVGDDDQAIYRWRGAAAANLLAFRQLYPGAREVVLTENHRSTQAILDAAARLISYNNPLPAGGHRRHRQAPALARGPAGPPVRHLHFDTVSAEADGVAAPGRGAAAAGLPAARPRDPRAQQRRRRPVPARPQRAGACRTASAAAAASTRARRSALLVSFLRVLASPDDSVRVFYLAALRDVPRCPRSTCCASTATRGARAGRCSRCCAACRRTRSWLGIGGAAREARGAAAGRPRARRGRRAAPAHGRGALPLPAVRRGCSAALAREASAAAEAQVKNIARFFDAVKAYGDYAEHDQVPAFVAHLDLLREAGDDPAVAEADPDDDAVPVLTVHKAKGLEFPVVFLVGCVEQRFPVKRRADALALPADAPAAKRRRRRRAPPGGAAALLRGHDAGQGRADPDLGRRLRHRARAQGLALRGGGARPAVAGARAAQEPGPGGAGPPPARAGAGARPGAAPARRRDRCTLSFRQIDDYETCPLKYQYVHRLRVPLLVHHRDRVRPRDPQGGAGALPRPRRRARVLRGRPRGRVQRGLGVRGLPVARPRGAAAGRGGGRRCARFYAQDAARRWRPTGGRAGLRVLRRTARGSRAATTSWSRTAGAVTILDFKTGGVRRPEDAERARAGEPAARRLRARAPAHARAGCPSGWSCASWSRASPAASGPTLDEAAATEAASATSRARIRAPRVRGAAVVPGLRPVRLPRHLPPHRLGAAGPRREPRRLGDNREERREMTETRRFRRASA